ncbi:hypothetical protein D9M68_647740 [compost metagenome]
MTNDTTPGLAGSWHASFSDEPTTPLEHLNLPDGVLRAARILLEILAAAETSSALAQAEARAAGFVHGVESIGEFDALALLELDRMFRAAAGSRTAGSLGVEVE